MKIEYEIAIHNIDDSNPTEENKDRRCCASGQRIILTFLDKSLQTTCSAPGCNCRVDIHPTTRINIG